MSADDPDIAALAARLGLRGLRYRSFARAPAWAAARTAKDDPARDAAPAAAEPQPAAVATWPAAAVPPPADAPRPAAAASLPAVEPPPLPIEPLPAAAAPFAAVPPFTVAPREPASLPAAPPQFPLLADALARAAGQSPPDPVPDAARPFAALRLAVARSGGAAGR